VVAAVFTASVTDFRKKTLIFLSEQSYALILTTSVLLINPEERPKLVLEP